MTANYYYNTTFMYFRMHFKGPPSYLLLILLKVLTLTSSILLILSSNYTNYKSSSTKRPLEKGNQNISYPPDQKKYYFVVFLIPSMPDDTEVRNFLRSSWVNISAWGEELDGVSSKFVKFKVMFIIGKEAGKTFSKRQQDEMSKNSDMFVFEEAIEHRTILRYKVIWGMKISRTLYRYSYLVKLDTDTFVDLPLLLQGLAHLPRHGVYAGECRLRLGGYAARAIPGASEYRYCSGAGYVLSQDLVEELLDMDLSWHTSIITPEDGFVGWLLFQIKGQSTSQEIPLKRHNITNVGLRRMAKQEPKFTYWMQHKVRGLEEMRHLYNKRLNSV